MKNYFISAFVILFASWSWGKETFPNIKTELPKLANKYGVNLSDVGAYASIGEGDTLEVVIDTQGQKMMIPASITKVATASTVLAHFPPGYKFKTQIYSTGTVQDGVLKGDLYLKGGGDPSFVSENMWFLVNVFTRSGIKKVEGNIIVDDSLFDKVRFDESRQKARVDRAYDAPVGAMSFNWNSVNLFVRPGKIGQEADITVDPENDYVRFVNKTKVMASGGNKLIADRLEDKKYYGDIVQMTGSIQHNYPEYAVFVSITQPDLWSGYNLKSFLSQRGVTITGTVKNGIVPDRADLRADSDSKSIESILADMNKFSNNYVAEMLTKNLASLKAKPANLSSGVAMINDHLKSLNLPKDQYVIENPSGLTRENKMSSYAMWMVLQHLRKDFQVQPEFLTSLPIAGIDGTLKRRMKDSQAERWVRAKTGSLNGVVSLAGYAGLQDGRVVTFSMIYNGSTDEAKVRAFFDQLLIYLVK